jgi:hypothetical protein
VVVAVRQLQRENLLSEEVIPYCNCAIAYPGSLADPVVTVERLSVEILEQQHQLYTGNLLLKAFFKISMLVLTVGESYFLGEVALPYQRSIPLTQLTPSLNLAGRQVDDVTMAVDQVRYQGRVYDSRPGKEGLVECTLALHVVADLTIRFLHRQELPLETPCYGRGKRQRNYSGKDDLPGKGID